MAGVKPEDGSGRDRRDPGPPVVRSGVQTTPVATKPLQQHPLLAGFIGAAVEHKAGHRAVQEPGIAPWPGGAHVRSARSTARRPTNDSSTSCSRALLAAGDAAAAPGARRERGAVDASRRQPRRTARVADRPAGTTCCVSNVCTHRGRVIIESEDTCRAVRRSYHRPHVRPAGPAALGAGMKTCAAFPPGLAGPLAAGGRRVARVPLREPRPGRAVRGVDRLRRAPWCGSRGPTRCRRNRPRGDYEIDAHWAVYVDNYLEGFHIPFVHEALVATIDWSDYVDRAASRGAACRSGWLAEGEPVLELPDDHPVAGRRVAAFWVQLFPNTLLNFYPWGLSINQIEPLRSGPDACATGSTQRARSCATAAPAPTSSASSARTSARSRRRSAAWRSRLYRGGRYAPGHEDAVRHFHDWLRTQLEAKQVALSLSALRCLVRARILLEGCGARLLRGFSPESI